MAKKRKYRGHYCKICDSIVANEKFSGKGHSSHVCKKCSKLTLAERKELKELNRIYGVFRYLNLSKANKLMLENYLKSESEKVRVAAQEVIDEFYDISVQIKIYEEYEEMTGIDTKNDEYLDDEDGYIEELYSIDEDDDELPF